MKSNTSRQKHLLRAGAICALSVSALGLSGCAQMLNLGDLIWTEGKHATVNTGQKLMAVLRPKAPRADSVFVENTISAYEGAPQYSPPALRGSTHKTEDARSIEIEFYQRPNTSDQAINIEFFTPETIAPVQSAERFVPTPKTNATAPFQGSETELALAPSAEPDMPDMAYVKLSGATSIGDWQSCQGQAGSYIQPRGAGFIVHPDFDYCMRTRGYIPEREALVYMERVALP